MDCHLVHYGFVPDWEGVWAILWSEEYKTRKGEIVRIFRAGIDSGGGDDQDGFSRTEEVYSMVRKFGRRILWATKGLSRNTQTGVRVRHTMLEKMRSKDGRVRPIPGGVVLVNLDSHALKDAFEWRRQNGKVTLHSETEMDFARHITAEEKRRNEKGKMEWVRVRRNNHLLDATVIAHACADNQWSGGIRIFAKAKVSVPVPDNPDKKPGFNPSFKIKAEGRGWLRR